ncbi:MAG: hypothetical protein L0Z71_17585 [Anaerolineae bacterium]|nr:hypothetical protein [Anaerolineae bacterium]
MNKDIFGIIVLFIFASPVIALVMIIAFKIFRKFRPRRQELRIEKQPERKLENQYMPHKPAIMQRTVFNFIAATVMAVLAGLVIGIVTSLFSNLIYIVFVFPLVIGFAGGTVITGAVKMAKIRKINQVIFMSLLVAISIYGTYHYGGYVSLQVQTSLEMFPGLSTATEDKNLKVTKAVVDYAIEQETGYSGFVGYMFLRAKEGVSIGRFYHSNRLNLGPILTWFYWILEFGTVLGVMIIMGKKQTSMPFCESCGNWYGKKEHLGGMTRANESLLLDLIKQKDFIEMGKLIEKNAELPSVEIYFQGCEICNQSSSRLLVRRAFQSSQRGLQFTDASQTILQPKDSRLLLNHLRFIRN